MLLSLWPDFSSCYGSIIFPKRETAHPHISYPDQPSFTQNHFAINIQIAIPHFNFSHVSRCNPTLFSSHRAPTLAIIETCGSGHSRNAVVDAHVVALPSVIPLCRTNSTMGGILSPAPGDVALSTSGATGLDFSPYCRGNKLNFLPSFGRHPSALSREACHDWWILRQ